MTYKQNFLRLVASGTLYTNETFAFGLNCVSAPGGTTPTAPTEVPEGIINAMGQFFSMPGFISQNAVLETLKLNEIGTNGKYVNNETVLYEYEPGIPGASSSPSAPQLALAITLDTGLRRGRASRGRFYIPSPGRSVGPLGTIGTSDANSYLVEATSLVNAINDALVAFRVGVVSDIGSGYQNYVTNVRIGRVLDTIRSRRTSIEEDYLVGPPVDDADPTP